MINKRISANLDINHRSDICPNQQSALMIIKVGWGSAENLPEDDMSRH